MKTILSFLQNHQGFFINLITIVIFFALPYWIFEGKLFVGGDDTRLIYAYPWEYLRSMSFFSWINLSSVGYFAPNHFSYPFALIWTALFLIIKSRVVIDYLSFSLPIILGFIYFKKLIKEFLPRSTYVEQYISTIFYLLSPILAINQLAVFLMSAWLVGLFPFVTYHYICYVKTAKTRYVVISVMVCIFLSLAFYSIPWLAGLLLPVVLGLPVGLLLFKKYSFKTFFIRSIIFFGFIFLSQSFWTIPFVMQFLVKGNGLGDLISDRASTFRATVVQTSTGNIIYPLLNLFHRDLTFTHEWDLRKIFLSFYDKTFFFNTIFIAVIFAGLFNWEKKLTELEGKMYLLVLSIFLISLFFYTVNIGPLKEVFLFLGYLPGFSMFRNAFDKFALGFVFLYGIFFSFSIVIVLRKFSKYRTVILLCVLLVIVVNAFPLKRTINSPLWTTNRTYRAITFPQEYFQFLSLVKNTTDPTSNILNFPLNIAGYAIVKDDTTNNVFAGTSPTKFFTGINDYSGDLSFSRSESDRMWKYIDNRDYEGLRNFYYTYNVGAVLVTKNIPQEVKRSYLFFGGSKLHNQDRVFLDEITDKKLLTSSQGNYELYSIKKPNIAISMRQGLFQKVSPVKYQAYMHLTSPDELSFIDSYHNGWRLYLEKYHNPTNCIQHIVKTMNNVSECKSADLLFQWNDLSYLFRPSLAQTTHGFSTKYNNTWKVDPTVIQNQYNPSFFKKNPDGSIDVLISIYFIPQEAFYAGMLITAIVLLGMIPCLLFVSKKYAKKK